MHHCVAITQVKSDIMYSNLYIFKLQFYPPEGVASILLRYPYKTEKVRAKIQ